MNQSDSTSEYMVVAYDFHADSLERSRMIERMPEIQAICDRAFYTKRPGKQTDVEDIQRALLQASVVIFAFRESDKKILGFAVGIEMPHFTGFELFFHDVVTVPEYQNNGVMSAIMKKMEECADERRVKRDMLYTERDNEPAMNFYIQRERFAEREVPTVLLVRQRR